MNRTNNQDQPRKGPTPTSRSKRAALDALLALTGLTLALAAAASCGGDDSNDAPAESSTQRPDDRSAEPTRPTSRVAAATSTPTP
ncbi:MAG TPA: hypothetical protein VFY54_21185, partial [Rubrobacter sp.]|nr:hypothetical protein [Rubrobacter sp.]